MALETFANGAFNYLNGDIDSSATTVTVHDARRFPSTGQFRIRIGSEILLATRATEFTLSVLRGQEGTTASYHNDGMLCIHILTQGGMDQYLNERVLFAKARPQSLIYGSDDVRLTVSDFSWTNQGTATATDVDGAIVMTVPLGSGVNYRMLTLPAESTPWTMTLGYSASVTNTTVAVVSAPEFGLVTKDASINRWVIQCNRLSGNANDMLQQIGVKNTNSVTTGGSYQLARNTFSQVSGPTRWMRMTDTGTNLVHYWSVDGVNWIEFESDSRTSYLTNGPGPLGFFINNNGLTTNLPPQMTVKHFSIT